MIKKIHFPVSPPGLIFRSIMAQLPDGQIKTRATQIFDAQYRNYPHAHRFRNSIDEPTPGCGTQRERIERIHAYSAIDQALDELPPPPNKKEEVTAFRRDLRDEIGSLQCASRVWFIFQEARRALF